jgi:hypothetical protein
VVRFTQPPYGTFDAAEWAPSTASKADIATWIFYWRGAPVRVLSLCRDSAIIFGDQFSAPLKNWEALLRVSFLTALVVFAPISLCADPASAGAFDAVFGTRHPYEGPWCAYMNTGAGRVEEDCTVESLAACRQMVIAGNRLLHPEPGIHRLL